MTRHVYIVLIMHTKLFYWAAQILHRVFDIPIWIPTLHLDDDDNDDDIDDDDDENTHIKTSLIRKTIKVN